CATDHQYVNQFFKMVRHLLRTEGAPHNFVLAFIRAEIWTSVRKSVFENGWPASPYVERLHNFVLATNSTEIRFCRRMVALSIRRSASQFCDRVLRAEIHFCRRMVASSVRRSHPFTMSFPAAGMAAAGHYTSGLCFEILMLLA